mgnify:FL=1
MTVDFLDSVYRLSMTLSHHSSISYPSQMLLLAIPTMILTLYSRLVFSGSIHGTEAQSLSWYADYIIITQTLLEFESSSASLPFFHRGFR